MDHSLSGCMNMKYVYKTTYVGKSHFCCSASWGKTGIHHDISRYIHRIVQITINLRRSKHLINLIFSSHKLPRPFCQLVSYIDRDSNLPVYNCQYFSTVIYNVLLCKVATLPNIFANFLKKETLRNSKKEKNNLINNCFSSLPVVLISNDITKALVSFMQ